MNKYDEIISSCEGLIYMIINNCFRGYNVEDLYQVGVIGVIKAYDRYKENRMTKFSTYAYKWIYGEIYAYINDSRLIKASKENVKLYKRVIDARAHLCQTFMREPSINEIALFVGESPNTVADVLSAMQNVDSIERVIFEGDKDISIKDTIEDPRSSNNIDYLYLEDELSRLPYDERTVLYYRYFEDKTQSEISRLMNIHQVEVSRTENRALKKIRKNYQNVA